MLYDINKQNKRSTLNPGFWNDFTGRDLLSDFYAHPEHSTPAINVASNEEEYIIDIAAPGMCKDDYNIKLDNDRLTIKGNKKKSEDKNRYTQREFVYHSFEKSFVIPKEVKAEAVAASCADGVLSIHLPKREPETESKRKKIEIT